MTQTPVNAGEEYYVRVRGATNDVDLDLTIGAADAQAPVVMSVHLGDSNTGTWFSPAVGSGAQLASTPWATDQVRLTFSENVQVTAGDLLIGGVNVASYGVLPGAAGFHYDAATHTATWTLAQPLSNDKVFFSLSDSVQDAGANSLDGEWQNPAGGSAAISSVFPSGDSTPGGTFELRLNFLDGDVDQNGIVDLRDVAFVRDVAGGAIIAPSADVNHDGIVNRADLLYVARRMFQMSVLPGTEPSSPAAPSPAAPAAVVVAAPAAPALRTASRRQATAIDSALSHDETASTSRLRATRALRRTIAHSAVQSTANL